MTNLHKLVYAELWYGLGIICGNGHNRAVKIVRRSDSDALYEDWKHIGEYFQKSINAVDLELRKDGHEKEALISHA